MSQPTPYDPTADYSVDISPGNLGNALDADFADIQLTLDETLVNLSLIQRDDAGLRNGIVHPDALSAETVALLGRWTLRGVWVTATVYSPLDFVTNSGIGYVALATHVSGTFATDLAAGKWTALSKVDSLTSAFSLTLLDDTTASAWLTTLGVSAFAKTLLDDASAGVARATLGSSTVGDAVFVAASATAVRATLGVPSNAEAILATIVDAAGDLIFGTANDTVGRLAIGGVGGLLQVNTGATAPEWLAIGANGTVPMPRTISSVKKLAYVAPFTSHGYGSTWSHNAGDVTNDFDFAVGGCMDATGAYWMRTTTIIGKQADVAWAVGGTAGATAGMLDTGAVGNNEYYLWMIARSDTGVVDWLSSLSSTAPTMPANYDFKRLRGYFRRLAGVNTLLDVYETEGSGIALAWRVPTLDINLAATLTTSRRTDAVKVPLAFSTIANLAVYVTDAAAWNVNIVCPDTTDAAVGASPDSENITGDAGGRALTATMRVRTSATGTIAARASIATIDTYQVSTRGFTWARRQ